MNVRDKNKLQSFLLSPPRSYYAWFKFFFVKCEIMGVCGRHHQTISMNDDLAHQQPARVVRKQHFSWPHGVAASITHARTHGQYVFAQTCSQPAIDSNRKMFVSIWFFCCWWHFSIVDYNSCARRMHAQETTISGYEESERKARRNE